MIRIKTLLCKLNLLNFSDIDIFNSFSANISIIGHTCPYCKATSGFTIHSTYDRNMITISNGKRDTQTVTIQRIMCTCGHTHALLPDILIPFGSYTLKFVIKVLLMFLTRKCNVDTFCEKWELSKSTIYTWIHLFELHYNLWHSSLKHISAISTKAIHAVCFIDTFPSLFYNSFKFSFMQMNSLPTRYKLSQKQT